MANTLIEFTKNKSQNKSEINIQNRNILKNLFSMPSFESLIEPKFLPLTEKALNFLTSKLSAQGCTLNPELPANLIQNNPEAIKLRTNLAQYFCNFFKLKSLKTFTDPSSVQGVQECTREIDNFRKKMINEPPISTVISSSTVDNTATAPYTSTHKNSHTQSTKKSTAEVKNRKKSNKLPDHDSVLQSTKQTSVLVSFIPEKLSAWQKDILKAVQSKYEKVYSQTFFGHTQSSPKIQEQIRQDALLAMQLQNEEVEVYFKAKKS